MHPRHGWFLLGAVFTLVGCKDSTRSPMAEMAAAAAHHGELSNAIPILAVANLKRSQAYFRDRLGFEVEWEYGDPPNFGSVGRSGTRFFLCQRCPGRNVWTMVFAKDVDALHAEFVRKGANIRQAPTDEPWDIREMQVVDLDGNVIRFGSHKKK
jgi:catechol 2,3-dioxygenase-like lactoylglutathione lyase family enzyme